MAVSVSTPEKVTRLLNKNALYLEDMALQTSNYQANGFVGAFTINILSSNIQKPDNYSKDAVDALLDGYTEQDKSDNFSSPDIILVLSESFWDPTLLPGTTFSADPLENYREIASRENHYLRTLLHDRARRRNGQTGIRGADRALDRLPAVRVRSVAVYTRGHRQLCLGI